MERNARLSLALLGGFEVTLDGQPVTSFESVKVRALLAYLAVEAHRSHARAVLAELLWPELPAATALTYLRHVLANLRRAIQIAAPGSLTGEQPFLLITRESVAFNPAGDYWLDVAELTALLEHCAACTHRRAETCAACARRRAAAVALYRGDFLSHLVLGDSAAFEEWAALKRERLRQQVLAALARLTAYHERRGALHDAEGCAWRQLELDPWREEGYQQLMRVLWLSGQRSAALEQYARCRQILEQELGVEPDAATTALYDRIRDAEPDKLPAARPLASPDLPAQTTSLVGRETKLDRLVDLLQQPRYRLLTLTGAGGIGKTRLALAVARDLDGEFADGVRFVALAPVADPAMVVAAVAQALGVAESRSRPLLESLKVHLRAKELLLVLDNFEHVGAAAPGIAELLGAAPRLTVLVTSRAALRVYGEQEFPVPPLSLPDLQRLADPEELRRSDAVRLFVARSQAVQPTFALNGETAAVGAICHRLEGMPLAIELAAARIRLLSPPAMLERLSSPLALLVGGPQDLPLRQQTLRATIDWSYRLLTAGEQQLLSRLAVFMGGWTLEAAEAISGEPGSAPGDALNRLDVLVAKSLVRRLPAATPRFGMFETIHEYALERLDATGEAVAVRRRHLQFFRDLAETAEPHLKGSDQVTWLAQLDDEHPNLRAALAWALEQGAYADGLRLATAINWFWRLRGHDREAFGWLRRLLTSSQDTRIIARARALPAATFIAWILGEVDQARAWCKQGVHLGRETGDLASLAHSLIMSGWIEPEHGQRVAWMDEALDVARRQGDPWWVAMALWFKSEVYDGRDDQHAQALMEASLPLFREIGDRWSLGWLLTELGELLYRHGDYDRAALLFEESLAQFTGIGNSAGIAAALYKFGVVAYDRGENTRAAALLDDSLNRFRESGVPHMTASLLCARAKVALAEGDVELARTLLEESRALFQSVGHRSGSGRSLYLLGRAALARGEPARARDLLRASLQERQDGAAADTLESLEGLAALTTSDAELPVGNSTDARHAVTLLGAAAAAREALGLVLSPGERAACEHVADVLRARLDAAAWQAAWADGLAMTLQQAVDYALQI